MRRVLGLGALTLIVAALPELAHGLASRFGYGRPELGTDSTEAVVVLGCPTNPDGSLHPLQQWRVDIARRTITPRVGVVVFTGRTAATGRTEAAAMAEYGRSIGIPEELIVLEERAESTWENLKFSAPLIEQHEVLRLVSDPMHAFRARAYLTQQDPELAAKLAPADDYRCFEHPRWKIGTMLYEIRAWWRSLALAASSLQR